MDFEKDGVLLSGLLPVRGDEPHGVQATCPALGDEPGTDAASDGPYPRRKRCLGVLVCGASVLYIQARSRGSEQDKPPGRVVRHDRDTRYRRYCRGVCFDAGEKVPPEHVPIGWRHCPQATVPRDLGDRTVEHRGYVPESSVHKWAVFFVTRVGSFLFIKEIKNNKTKKSSGGRGWWNPGVEKGYK